MNKKSLFLLASVVITAGIMSGNTVISAPSNSGNGAILYQMTVDDTGDLDLIEGEFPFGECDMVERARRLIDYYSKKNNYERIREVIQQTYWDYIENIQDPKEKEEKQMSLEGILRQLKTANQNNVQYYLILAEYQGFMKRFDDGVENVLAAYRIDKTNMIMDLISARQEALSGNIANMDTPGYVRKDVEFSQYLNTMNSPLETKLSQKLGPSGVIQAKNEQLSAEDELAEMQKNSLLYGLAAKQMTSVVTQIKSVINVGKS